ncbi:MAG: sodium-dependent transporter [Prevotella sp.]|nr:sodium-dependent transporter [Prevotella sp.]
MALQNRAGFASKLGIVLATAGSAVGLGNIWRFPFMTGQNGGAAFILIYIGCILLLGIPGMISEFIVGRHAGSNAVSAYGRLSSNKWWKIVGVMGIFSSTVILGFYSVVAGWCLQYLYASVVGQLNGDAAFVSNYFASFSGSIVKPILWGLTFIIITHLVVIRGVRNGIEKASKLMMPTLFVLLLIIVVASCMLPEADKGITFLLRPDFSKLTGGVFLSALGQAFFSLSLGTACLCTYASYFDKNTNLAKSASQIALVDCLVAILAGLMIFPAAFSVGVSPDSGPSLIFITLPNVFQQAFAAMPVIGYIISIFFYALLALAALTSTISMHEIGTAFFHEELKLSRKNAAWIITVVAGMLCIFSSLSVGACDNLQLFGMSLMDFFDFLTAQILLPLGALLTCVYVGWVAPQKVVCDEFTNFGTIKGTLFVFYLFAVRFICPIGITLIFLDQFGVI